MNEALAGRRRWIWGAAAVVVLALLIVGGVRALTADAVDKPTAVATVTVDRGAVTTEVATSGTVQPAQTRSLSFAVAGTVESVSVRPGTTVTVGQVLAAVDDTDAVEAESKARDALIEANDALAEAREEASSTSATSVTTACGSTVAAAYATKAPEASTAPTSPPVPAHPSTPATTAPTATRPPVPTHTPTRATTAPKPTPAPTRKATTAPSRTGGSDAGGGSESGGDRTGGGTTGGGTCASSGAGGPAEQQGGGSDAILSAEQRVTQATTGLENAEAALAGASIKAPIAGRILSVSGKVGGQVNAGAAFITLADVYAMQISADFPEVDADRLGIRQKASVTLADRERKEFQATVVQVDPVGTSDGTMVRYGVLLAFDESPEGLLVGQSAAVRVITGAKEDVLRVPSAAVHNVAGSLGTVLKAGKQVKVTVGLRGDQYTEVSSGLSEGDEVVRSW